MKKIFAVLLSLMLASAFLCSCQQKAPVSQGTNLDSSLKTEYDQTTESNSDIYVSSEKDEAISSNASTSSKADKVSSKPKESSKKENSSKAQTSSVIPAPSYPTIAPSGEDFKEMEPIESEYYYGWRYLLKSGTTAQQQTYKAFESAFSQYEKTVSFDFKVSASDVELVYDIYMDDHPEEFFLGSATYNTDFRNNVVNFTVKTDMMSQSKDKIAETKIKAQDKAYEIVLKLFPNGVYKNEVETVRAVHDYLVNNIKYDKTLSAPNTHDMYGALINGTSVCEGYAEAFLYIMRLCGVECLMVNGTMSGQSHVWNMIRLEGDWYHIDVTSDDPILSSGEQVLRFEYFNLTDEEIGKTHVIEENVVEIPKATANKFNFFKYYGLEHSAINNDAFISSISFSLKNGYDTAYFKFTNNTPDQAIDYYLKNSKAIAAIVNNNNFGKRILGGVSVSYSQSKTKNILNLKLKFQ